MRYDGTNLDAVLDEHDIYLSKLKEFAVLQQQRLYWTLDPETGLGSAAIAMGALDLKEKDFEHLKADFSGASLDNVVVCNRDLSYANFQSAVLDNCSFYSTDLGHADFSMTQMDCCSFYALDMGYTNLGESIMRNSLFFRIMLRCSDMQNAHISKSVFNDCTFYMPDFYNCKFSHTVFKDSEWTPTGNDDNRDKFASPPTSPMACPNAGSFIGWKKAMTPNGKYVIVKLHIPFDAKRSSAFGRKCRCSKAKVLDISYMLDKDNILNPKPEVAVSRFDSSFKYVIGKMVHAYDFDNNRFHECAPGIHFFIDREDAVNY